MGNAKIINKKIKYIIDDLEYFRRELSKQCKPEEVETIINSMGKPSFKAVYTLFGIGDNFPDRYELTNENGDKININDLNGYQKGVVLNDCFRHYMGDITEMPTGCIEIITA